MVYLWDYDEKVLKNTEKGRILILERIINHGPSKKSEKINLNLVKKYWKKLDIYPKPKRLLELLIWGKYISSLKSKSLFSIK